MKIFSPSRKDFMSVGLVADIPDKGIMGRIINIMKRNGEFNNAETGAQMAGIGRTGINNKTAQFITNLRKLVLIKVSEVGRINDLIQEM